MNHKVTFRERILQNTTFLCTLFVFFIILLTILCFSWVPHCVSPNFIFPNIVLLFLGLLLGIGFYFLIKNIPASNRAFNISIIAFFIVFFILQIIIIIYAHFYTGWDAGLVNSLADSVANTGALPAGETYLYVYPNNNFLVTILALIKSIPFIGGHYLTILAVNALLVNLSGVFTCLTIKKLFNPKTALASLLIITPLLLFSPWIMIPYSDTFSILIPILIYYIYLSNHKWWKYFPITTLGVIGYFIKPTTIIILIAIFITELFSTKQIFQKSNLKKALTIITGIALAFPIKFLANSYINFIQDPSVQPVSFVHYLAMGQNDESCGKYTAEDSEEAAFGRKYEIGKFINRIKARNLCEQTNFFAKKLLTNYNDGTFAWSKEGRFYSSIPERNNPLSEILSNYYYQSGDNYQVFTTLSQTIWLFILFGCLFIKRKNPKSHIVIYLSLIGLFVFVMIFEARARYLFTYVPIFIICATIGYHNLVNIVKEAINAKN